MRFLIACLLLVSPLAQADWTETSDLRFQPVSERPTEGDLELARVRGLAAIEKTLIRLRNITLPGDRDFPDFEKALKRVSKKLNKAKIKTPKVGKDLYLCSKAKGAMAYTIAFPIPSRKIFLCQRLLEGGFPEKFYTQILVHEATHLMQWNECGATKIELAVMNLGDEGIHKRSSMIAKCGLTENYPFD